ncbi:DUF998 domain-containing protein [Streptomyces sp. NPDC087844]|uniref:DUF998 domain-containing protein n=1 Tax=Streptomyces sp. NPDC087844 TaxID=3365805 RepID=UPI0037FD0B62
MENVPTVGPPAPRTLPRRPTGRLTSPAHALAVGGTAAAALTVLTIVALDARLAIVSPGVLRHTISEYGLGPQRWLFAVAVLSLAFGSLAVVAALVSSRITRWRSGAAMATVLWSAGLTVVALVPKEDRALVEDTLGGEIHRVASLIAFVSLPIAARLLARPWRRSATWGSYAGRIRRLGLLSALAFAPILYAVGHMMLTGTPWWEILPLGIVERLLVGAEAVTVLAIGVWAVRASGSPTARPVPATPVRIHPAAGDEKLTAEELLRERG